MITFANAQDSHAHSRLVLDALYEFDDFMSSVGTVLDLGCGAGLDMQWWATRTTRDDIPQPLNIRVTGVDRAPHCATKHPAITYRQRDFTKVMDLPTSKFDVLWCHDSFQYVIDPFTTLSQWRDITNVNGMLILTVPQTTNIENRFQAFDQPDGCYWHWTMVNLIHVLAVSGWDCRTGFFQKSAGDPWIHAVVYRGDHQPRDPSTTRWYDLVEMKVLPQSADASILKQGYLRQRDLVLPWIDRSNTWMGNH